MKKYLVVYTVWLLNYSVCNGLKAYKENDYKAYSEFLKHESGSTILNGPVPDPQNVFIKDTSRINTHTSTTKVNNKRDYVAPTASPNAKKDSEFPPLKPKSETHKIYSNTHIQNDKQQSNSKRDYVANPYPGLPTKPSTPTSQQPGKVKDLINFYDNNGGNKNSKPFSYSSIVRGNENNKQKGSTSIVELLPSFEDTNGPTRTVPTKITPGPIVPTLSTSAKPPSHQQTAHRPTTGVMPSSIANNNNKESNNGVTDEEIRTLSEDLLKKDVNNAAKYITVNYQEKTTSFSKEDKAPLPLVVIPNNVWNLPTIKLFLPLLDNYERDTLINEHVTAQERNEENAFMDAIMATPVIRHLIIFLKDKGFVTPDPRQQRDFLKQLWFNLYSRGKGKISSSGFEHVFVSELKNGEVSGLHNWIYFAKEESANRANYLGYLKYVTLNDKGAVLKLHFNQLGVDKPVDSMFVGTSPELEMALYTLCFVTRASKECKLKLSGKDVGIMTHSFRYRSKNYIGSAYAQI